MNSVGRKKSPRAPSISLDDAIEKAAKIYEKERCHIAPADAAAQHAGYKNAANGAALSTMASMKYYGLLDRPREGMVAVSRDVEAYKFAPNELIRQEILTKWLRSPPAFAELLDQYPQGLPSDANLKYQLIQKGFAPAPAEQFLQVFRKSVDFVNYYERNIGASNTHDDIEQESEISREPNVVAPAYQPNQVVEANTNETDRIPVRLAGGRKAWIEIPVPFYSSDKERLNKQIELLLTDDEEEEDSL